MNHNVKGLVGAVVTGVGGIVAGYAAGAINNPKPPKYEEPKPICGCGHHISMHDDQGCHYTGVNRILKARTESQVESKVDRDGAKKSKTVVPAREDFDNVQVSCGCKKYVGPEPLPTYIS